MIIALSAGRDSPAELRSRLSLVEAGVREILRKPRPGVAELAVVSTCHRTEVYAAASGSEADAVHTVVSLLPTLLATDQHDLRFMQGSEAVDHLFRVACGLDSLVVGEPQVLGQVRRALVLAKEEAAAGPILSNVFGRAIRLGRRVRAETPLGILASSVGAIAADYLAERLSGLEGRPGAVVGAGKASGDAARSLRKAGARLAVVSRTPASARRLARHLDATAHPLDEISAVFDKCEFAVVAISGGPRVRADDLPRRSEMQPFVVLDLSVPPAVEFDGRSDVDLRTLEELPGPRGPEIDSAVVDAEAMVKAAVADLERWADNRASGPAIRELRQYAEHLVHEEVARTLGTMDLAPEEAERVAALVMRVANKLLHGPSTALREADAETRALIQRIFGVEP